MEQDGLTILDTDWTVAVLMKHISIQNWYQSQDM